MGFMQNFRYYFKKFPVKLILMRNYRNALDADVYNCRYEVELIKDTETGRVVERRYLVYREGKNLVFTPHFPLPVWNLLKNKDTIWLMEVDVDTYHAITMENQELIEHVPIYEWENFQHPETGETLKKKKLDKKGEPIITEVKQVLIMPVDKILNEKGELILRPKAFMSSNYDPKQWYGQELATDYEMYSKPSFFKQYGNVLIGILVVVALLVISYWFIGEFAKIADTTTKAQVKTAELIAGAEHRLASALAGQGANAFPDPPPS